MKQELASLLCCAAKDTGLIDPHKVEEILRVSVHEVERLKIQGANWFNDITPAHSKGTAMVYT